MIANIGALVGQSPDRMDVEFAVDPQRSPEAGATAETGIFSVIPTNIFAALSANDSLRVLSFALVFGIGMVMTERELGHSIFGALRHVQAVCITIFDWFSLLVPIGIVALIAPQVAQLGADAFRVLALFVYAFLATAFLLLSVAILLSALSLHVRSENGICGAAQANDARRFDPQHLGLHSDRARGAQGRSQGQARSVRSVHTAWGSRRSASAPSFTLSLRRCSSEY